MAEKIATREAYGKALAALADKYPDLVCFDADLAGATMTKYFKAACPERFFDMGIAEADMVGVAAGMSLCGFKPFVNTFAMFAAGRAWEQVRNSVAYPHLNVKVVGSHGGLSVGEDGATHQCIEDFAIMRAIPGMLVLCPCDGNEMRLAVEALVNYEGPAYMRLGRLAVETVTDSIPGYKFELGKGATLRDGTDVTIIAVGMNVQMALAAAENGIRALLPALGKVDMALVGEPTGMQAATGERGLVVLDCTAHGRSGHAARGEGVNALYIALDDIARLRSFRFGRESELLGPIGIAVTQIEAGTQHNVVPDTCRFVVDVRTTDAYSNEETVGILRAALRSEAVPRSTRIRAAAVGGEHPLVKAAVAAGRETYVSPTTSDRTLMPFPALKMGPGQSSRSHTADEFVLLEEIAEGIAVYEKYIGKLAQEYGWKTLG